MPIGILKLRHLKWFLFGRPEYPPRVWPKAGNDISKTSKRVAFLYADGGCPKLIAQRFGVTRERVRQILWKEYYRVDPNVPFRTLPNYFWTLYYRVTNKDFE